MRHTRVHGSAPSQLIYNFPEQLFADAGVMAIEHADFDGIERLALVTGGAVHAVHAAHPAHAAVCGLLGVEASLAIVELRHSSMHARPRSRAFHGVAPLLRQRCAHRRMPPVAPMPLMLQCPCVWPGALDMAAPMTTRPLVPPPPRPRRRRDHLHLR